MESHYIIPAAIIIIEFSLVLLIVVLTYISKGYLKLSEKNKHRKHAAIRNKITQTIQNKTSFSKKFFHLKSISIELILPILSDLDELFYNDAHWKLIKESLLLNVIFPAARKDAFSKNWHIRFFAAKAFSLQASNENEPFIVKLVSDKIPLIYFNAIQAAITNKSEKAITLIIHRLAQEAWQTESFYLQAFDNAPAFIGDIVRAELHTSQDPSVRAASLYTLLKLPPQKASWKIEDDIFSEYFPLKVAAIRYISYTDREKAIPLLIKSLASSSWEVKTVTLRHLSNLKAIDHINIISQYLYDKNLSVRLAAAYALRNLGEKGRYILKSLDKSRDSSSYEIASHVLGRVD